MIVVCPDCSRQRNPDVAPECPWCRIQREEAARRVIGPKRMRTLKRGTGRCAWCDAAFPPSARWFRVYCNTTCQKLSFLHGRKPASAFPTPRDVCDCGCGRALTSTRRYRRWYEPACYSQARYARKKAMRAASKGSHQ